MAAKTKETKTKTLRKITSKPRLSNKETVTSASTALNRLSGLKIAKNKPAVIALVGILVVLVIFLLYLFKGLFVVAVVNGEPITRLSVVRELEKQSGKSTLDNIITKKLILQEAKKRNVVVTKAEIDSELKKIEENLKSQGTSLDQALQLQGMTKTQLNDEIRIQLSIQRMVESNIKLSDKEINEFITENKDNFPEGLTEAQMKDQAKESLKQQKLQEKTQAFLEDLKKKAKVLNFVNY